jgi:hypothetical protein
MPRWDLVALSVWLIVVASICLTFVGIVKLVELLT